ncbi:hypothetical protein BKA69DRAFT_1120985 [Paraphysoderma sedebokerense]|nr:hypothetical protein BKA69DRAFT_1120985 [Paraphysoderma sedebokerense]
MFCRNITLFVVLLLWTTICSSAPTGTFNEDLSMEEDISPSLAGTFDDIVTPDSADVESVPDTVHRLRAKQPIWSNPSNHFDHGFGIGQPVERPVDM